MGFVASSAHAIIQPDYELCASDLIRAMNHARNTSDDTER